MLPLGVLPLAMLMLAALLVGVSKTAVSGVGALSVALFAAVLPARESTGVLLPLLLVGDVLAVRAYRGHADRAVLLRLLPSVAAGVLLGVVFVARTDDVVMRRTIGVLLLAVAVHHGWQRARANSRSRVRCPTQAQALRRAQAGQESPDVTGTTPTPRQQRLRTVLFGLIAGFATMVANAGGPAMSLYLLSSGFGMLGFLGTGAWFFLIVNLVKVPFSVGLGLVTADGLALDALLVLAVVVGARAGRALVHRIDQSAFERLVLVFTALAGVGLLR
ncbi:MULTISPECIES: sulfite exporter TauE/SafE family protein [unclassified Streptomyces]|uniref:sulfite exporter TauE/SafE family protein n=1 Tax=unclassified Streptomyces TaxID=2593676 RepID=UPI000477B52F|nr:MULTISPECIES: sulfite exporter TauE/SafE family protein [unclassified Streptomyces]MYT28203.1 TSUP family transporter [Streptomyces sp. SID8354]